MDDPLGVIVLGLSDHDVTFCTRKTLRPKSHKHNEPLAQLIKHYTVEYFKQTLKNQFPRLLKMYQCKCCIFKFYK